MSVLKLKRGGTRGKNTPETSKDWDQHKESHGSVCKTLQYFQEGGGVASVEVWVRNLAAVIDSWVEVIRVMPDGVIRALKQRTCL